MSVESGYGDADALDPTDEQAVPRGSLSVDAFATTDANHGAPSLTELDVSRILRSRALLFRAAVGGLIDASECVAGHACTDVEIKYVFEDLLVDFQVRSSSCVSLCLVPSPCSLESALRRMSFRFESPARCWA